MNWTLTEADEGDASKLSVVSCATFLETFAGVLDGDAIIEHCVGHNTPAAYARYLQAGARAWLAALEPGAAPVGFAMVTSPDLPGAANDGSDLELKRIYLLSRFQGLGIGGALMRNAIEVSRSMGAKRLLLGVYASNSKAKGFYCSLGFAQIGSRRFRVGDREYDDTVLALNLS